VSEDAPATAPEGKSDGDLRVAVADGVLTAWRVRPAWQVDGPALDRLAADAAAVLRHRGLDGRGPVGPAVRTASTEG
jgi:hypothetical protein